MTSRTKETSAENLAISVENPLAVAHNEKNAQGDWGLRDNHEGVSIRVHNVLSTDSFYPDDAERITAEAPELARLTAILDRENHDQFQSKPNSYGAIVSSRRDRIWKTVEEALLDQRHRRQSIPPESPNVQDKATGSQPLSTPPSPSMAAPSTPSPSAYPPRSFLPEFVAEYATSESKRQYYVPGREGKLSKLPDSNTYLHRCGSEQVTLESHELPPAVRTRVGKGSAWIRLRTYDDRLESVPPKSPPNRTPSRQER